MMTVLIQLDFSELVRGDVLNRAEQLDSFACFLFGKPLNAHPDRVARRRDNLQRNLKRGAIRDRGVNRGAQGGLRFRRIAVEPLTEGERMQRIHLVNAKRLPRPVRLAGLQVQLPAADLCDLTGALQQGRRGCQRTAHAILLGHIVEHQHCANDLVVSVANRCGAVGDLKFLPVASK